MTNRLTRICAFGATAVVVAASGGIYANAETNHHGRGLQLVGHKFLFSADAIPLPGGDPVTGVAFVLEFTDAHHMTFTQVTGPTGFGIPCENETVHVSRVRSGVYFTRWIESSGIAVSHVDDLRRHRAVVSSVLPPSITGAAGPTSISFTGRIAPYRGAPQPTCHNDGSGQ